MSDFGPVLRAAKDNNVAALRKLFAAGYSPNSCNGIGQAPTHVAAMWGCADAVELLLQSKANVNVTNQFGITPLHYAAQNSQYATAKILLLFGANTKAKSNNGILPWEGAKEDEMRALCGAPKLELHEAVKNRDMARLVALISKGADITETDQNGQTALHLAITVADATTDALPWVKALLAQNADQMGKTLVLSTHNDDGMTPVHLAASKLLPSTVETLLEAAPVNIDLKTRQTGKLFDGSWGRRNDSGKVEELDNEDMTALHIVLEKLEEIVEEEEEDDQELSPVGLDAPSAHAACAELVRMLLRYKADVNQRSLSQRAPLHQAVAARAHAIVKMLLDARADPTLGCKDIGMANNVLHQAIIQRDSEVMKLLIAAAVEARAMGGPAAGLNIDGPGQNGWTPLCLAARAGDAVMVGALLDAGADAAVTMAENGKTALDIAQINKKAAIVQLLEK